MNIHSFSYHARRFIEAVLDEDLTTAAELLQCHPEILADRNRSKETPIHWLAVENQLEGVRLLIEQGADASTQDDYGRTVLMDAAGLGLSEVCALLLKSGADPNDRHWRNRETALHCAARHSPRGDVVEMLIAAGAEVDARDNLDQTPLCSAASFGNLEVARVLLAHGADPNAKDGFGCAPLHELGAEASVELLELLLAHGALLDSEARERLSESNNEALRRWLTTHENPAT